MIRSGSTVSWALKVVLVGAVCAGKTSLVRSLVAGEPRRVPLGDRTRGVDLYVEHPFKPDPSKPFEIVFWDFAGHAEYHSTHQLFLSGGALFLLVVDLKRFFDDDSSRGDTINIWLDTLLCRVPGSVVQVVATHTDQLCGNQEDALRQLKEAVTGHLAAKRAEHELALKKCGNKRPMRGSPTLRIIDNIAGVSSENGDRLAELGAALAEVVIDGTGELLAAQAETVTQGAESRTGRLFPNVGKRIPVICARASAVMNALRDGVDPVKAAKLEPPSACVNPRVRYLHWEDAARKWGEVVVESDISGEVGGQGSTVVLEDAVRLKEQAGMFLLEHGLLHLDPTWMNELLRAILDHRLQDRTEEEFWRSALMDFEERHAAAGVEFNRLFQTHETFCSTGTLTVSYLHFLWRDVAGIGKAGAVERLLKTMCEHGVVLRSSFAPSTDMDQVSIGSSAGLIVPVRLQSYVSKENMEEFSEPCVHNSWRRQMVFRLWQSYMPAGIIGLLMARFLCDDMQFHCCWSRGLAFMMCGPEVILYLNAPGTQCGEAGIEINVTGQPRSNEVEQTVRKVREIVEQVLREHFPGLRFALIRGHPRSIEGQNALLDKIDSLEAHLDVRLDLIESDLKKIAESSQKSLKFLDNLQATSCPYPRLVFVREHDPGRKVEPPGAQRRILSKATFKALSNNIRGWGKKEMRLHFLCPFDYGEVPCGPNGEGYLFKRTREWVKKLVPVLQVTAVMMKVAFKAASGLELPVSEFLNAVKEGLGEDLADRVLDENSLRSVMLGEAESDKRMQRVAGASYEDLKTFMEKQQKDRQEKLKGKGKGGDDGYIEFDKKMERVENVDGKLVWVRKENVLRWRALHPVAPSR